jgi:hypothetical protein
MQYYESQYALMQYYMLYIIYLSDGILDISFQTTRPTGTGDQLCSQETARPRFLRTQQLLSLDILAYRRQRGPDFRALSPDNLTHMRLLGPDFQDISAHIVEETDPPFESYYAPKRGITLLYIIGKIKTC